MNAAQMSASVRRAWKLCNKHRKQVGLTANIRPPRRYKVTLWLDADEYVDAVNLAAMRGVSLTKHGRAVICGSIATKAHRKAA